jgi:hypothetical protein
MAGIAQRNLFEANAVADVGTAYMQMPVYRREDGEAPVPILGAPGAAPNRK